MSIVCLVAARVKPPSSVVMTDAEFSAWCADHRSSEPAIDADDHIAEVVPMVDAPYIPTVADEFEETGYSIGLEGVQADVLDAFPDASARDILLHALDFSEGLYRGRRVHARQVGYELGVNGQFCERPDSIPKRFGLPFEIGWQAGADERADREAIMADRHQAEDAGWETGMTTRSTRRAVGTAWSGRKGGADDPTWPWLA